MQATDVGRYGTLSLLSPASATITSFGIDIAPLTFGSDPKSTVRLFYPTIAPTHALVEFLDSKAFLVVLGKSGVDVDGCHLREGTRVALGNGEDFVIQGKRFKFEYPPKAMRKFMDPSSPVKPSGRRVRLSMVRAAVIDSPTPGGKIVQLGHGEVMLREEGSADDLERLDSPFAAPIKSLFPTSDAPAQVSPSKSSIYPSLPDLAPPRPPMRPPSPQKDSLRGRVLVRRAMLAEDEQEEMEVAGGLFPSSDSESDRSSDGEGVEEDMDDDQMMVDSDPEIVPESDLEMHSEQEEEDEVVEIPTPKAFKFSRPSFGPGRQSLGGGPPVRPERPSFKLDLSVPSLPPPNTPVKKEEVIRKDIFTTPRRKKVVLSDAEKKAIHDRRKSALSTPDMFFAGRIPGLGPLASPMKLFGVKEEKEASSIFSSPATSKGSPRKVSGSPVKTEEVGTSVFGTDAEDSEEEEDPRILLEKMRDTMETMRARMSPRKVGAEVAIPRPESMEIEMDSTPPAPSRRSVSPSKDVSSPQKGLQSRSTTPSTDQVMLSPTKTNIPSRSRSSSPIKDVVARSQSPLPSFDLRKLISPKKSRTASPSPAPISHDAMDEVSAKDTAEPIPVETLELPSADVDLPDAVEAMQEAEEEEEVTPSSPPPTRQRTVSPTPDEGPSQPGPARRALRNKKASPPPPEDPPKRKATRGKKAQAPEAEEEPPKPKATRGKKASTPTPDEPRVTRGKRAPTPTVDAPRTRTRTKTGEIENEEPEPKTTTRKTRAKTESDIEVSDVEEPKTKGRKTRARTQTEPIPEEVEVVEVKTTTRSRAKKEPAVKQEVDEDAVPRTRTRTRTRTAGKA